MRTIKLSLLIFVFTLGYLYCAKAQEDSKISEFLPNLSTIPPSSLYNGIPDISIPLFTLKGRGITIPISISYEASGIKVHEEATSIGLGWTLNAGGQIVQETRDWHDFAGIKRIESIDLAGIKSYFESGTTKPAPTYEEYKFIRPNGSEPDYIRLLEEQFVRLNKFDNQADMFYYSCNGVSGKFVLSPDLKTALPLSAVTHKIYVTYPNTDADGYKRPNFEIVDEQGIKYFFKPLTPLKDSIAKTEEQIYVVDSIISPQKDKITFTYESMFYNKIMQGTKKLQTDDSYYQVLTPKTMPYYFIKSISLLGSESVEFEFGEKRYDIASRNVPVVKYVNLKDKNGNVIRKFQLYHSYFKSDPLMGYLPLPNSRWKRYPSDSVEQISDYTIRLNDSFITYKNVGKPNEMNWREGAQRQDVMGYLDGQKVKLPNCFGFGGYLFTKRNGKIYAMYNTFDYLARVPLYEVLCDYRQGLSDYFINNVRSLIAKEIEIGTQLSIQANEQLEILRKYIGSCYDKLPLKASIAFNSLRNMLFIGHYIVNEQITDLQFQYDTYQSNRASYYESFGVTRNIYKDIDQYEPFCIDYNLTPYELDQKYKKYRDAKIKHYSDARYNLIYEPKEFYPTIEENGMYYFEIDTTYMNLFLGFEGSQSDFRPFYKSKITTLRLRLDSINESCIKQENEKTLEIKNKPYKFTYNSQNLPDFRTSDYDHWGYYNFLNRPNLHPIQENIDSIFQKTYPFFNDTTMFEKGMISGFRGVNEERMKASIIDTVYYPNGGYIKYNFEANRARRNKSGTDFKKVGGLRIKSTEIGNGNGNVYYTNYIYNTFDTVRKNGIIYLEPSKMCSGFAKSKRVQYWWPGELIKHCETKRIIYDPKYPDMSKIGYTSSYVNTNVSKVWTPTPVTTNISSEYEYLDIKTPIWYTIDKKYGQANSLIPILKTNSGYVGYSHVGVQKVDKFGNSQGLTVYKFDVDEYTSYKGFNQEFWFKFFDAPTQNKLNYLSPVVTDLEPKGNVLEVNIVDNKGRLLQRTENTYHFVQPFYWNIFDYDESRNFLNNFRESFTITIANYELVSTVYSPSPNDQLNPITSAIPKLAVQRNTTYFPEQKRYVKDSTFYLYDGLNSEILVGDYELSDNTYIYSEGSGIFDPKFDAFSVEYGYYFKPFGTLNLIQKLEFKEGKKLRTRYWYPPSLAATGNIYKKMKDRNIISTAVKVEKFLDSVQIDGQKTLFDTLMNGAIVPIETFNYYGGSYLTDQKFLKFDNYASPVEIKDSKGNWLTSILAYNGRMPVIKATNVSYSTLNTVVASLHSNFESYLSSLGDMTTEAAKNSWKQFNIDLRNNSTLKSAQISTYTYNPLYGITSETSPAGITTYYEYDSFGRLSRVKDADGNILKENEYHYKE